MSAYRLAVVALLLGLVSGLAGAATINVPADHATIQAAIDAAGANDTIVVAAGTYDGSVMVNKTVTLTGAQAGVPGDDGSRPAASESIITGLVSSGGVQVSADDAVVDGFIIEQCNSGYGCGVYMSPAYSGADVRNNIIRDNTFGVYLGGKGDRQSKLRRNLLQNNNLPGSCTGDAIYSDVRVANVLVDDNKFVGNPTGAMVLVGGIHGYGPVTDLTITNNEVHGKGFAVSAQAAVYSEGLLTNLTISGNVIVAEGANIGVRVQGVDNAVISNNDISGCSDTAVDVQYLVSDVVVEQNRLASNARGVWLRGWATGEELTVRYNSITGSTIAGVVNDLAGNWPALTAIDARDNWWGSVAGPTHSSNVAYNPSVARGDAVSDEVTFAPWWSSCGGGIGSYSGTSFAPVTTSSPVASWPSIQTGINAVAAGGTVNVANGTYAERLSIGKSLTLRGPQYGVDPTADGVRQTPALEAIVTYVGLGSPNPDVLVDIANGVSGVVIDGFTLIGNPTQTNADTCVVRVGGTGTASNVTVGNNIMDGRFGILFKGGSNLTAQANRVTSVGTGILVQPNAASNVTFDGNLLAPGASPLSDAKPFYATGVTGLNITGNRASGYPWDGCAGSNLANVVASGNTFTGCRKGFSFWGNTHNVAISSNVLTGQSVSGMELKGQDITISGNTITGAGQWGIVLDTHVMDTDRVTLSGNAISSCGTGGVRIQDTAAAPVMRGVTIQSGSISSTPVGLSLDNVPGDGVPGSWATGDMSVGTLQLAASCTEFIHLSNATVDVDAQSASFGGTSSGAQIEAKVWHHMDDASLGLVHFNANQLSFSTIAWDVNDGKFYLCSDATNPASGVEVVNGTTYTYQGNPITCTITGIPGDKTLVVNGAAATNSLRMVWYLRSGTFYRGVATSTIGGAITSSSYQRGMTYTGGTWLSGLRFLTHTLSGGPAWTVTCGNATQTVP